MGQHVKMLSDDDLHRISSSASASSPLPPSPPPVLYCVCRRPDDGSLMIECATCENWFHLHCFPPSAFAPSKKEGAEVEEGKEEEGNSVVAATEPAVGSAARSGGERKESAQEKEMDQKKAQQNFVHKQPQADRHLESTTGVEKPDEEENEDEDEEWTCPGCLRRERVQQRRALRKRQREEEEEEEEEEEVEEGKEGGREWRRDGGEGPAERAARRRDAWRRRKLGRSRPWIRALPPFPPPPSFGRLRKEGSLLLLMSPPSLLPFLPPFLPPSSPPSLPSRSPARPFAAPYLRSIGHRYRDDLPRPGGTWSRFR